MAYIGRGTDNISNVEVLDNITFNGNSSYTLQKGGANFVPVSANNILLSIDGVVQANNFSVSGSTIDFGTAVTGTCNFVLHFGTGLITTVQDGAVTTVKIGDDAVTYAKLQNLATANRVLGSTSTGLIGETQIATAMVSDDAITYAKMQDTSAANRVLGAASAGTVGEVQVATDMIADAQVDESKLKISNTPTNGYFLSAQSGNTGGLTWAEAGGGGLIFIKKITASSDGAISFQNGSGGVVIDGTYDNYVIKFNNVRPADQNKNLNAQIYTGGTIRTSNYGTTTAVFDGAQGGVSNNTNFQDFTDNCGAWIGINNQSEKGLFGEICFSTPTDTSQFFTATYSGGTAYDGAYGRVKSYVGTGGYKTSGTAMDGIKFFFNSGNIAEGIFTLYGMVKA